MGFHSSITKCQLWSARKSNRVHFYCNVHKTPVQCLHVKKARHDSNNKNGMRVVCWRWEERGRKKCKREKQDRMKQAWKLWNRKHCPMKKFERSVTTGCCSASSKKVKGRKKGGSGLCRARSANCEKRELQMFRNQFGAFSASTFT